MCAVTGRPKKRRPVGIVVAGKITQNVVVRRG